MYAALQTVRPDVGTALVLAMASRRLLPQGGRNPGLVDTICRATCEALEYAGVGLVLTDRHAEVRFVNTVARPLLDGPMLRLLDGRLFGGARTDSARLHRAIEAVTTPGCDTAKPVALAGPGEVEPLHVNIAPLQLFAEAANAERLAMVVIAATPTPVDEGRLRQTFSLTPAEARLLSALVEGERLADYATRTGVKLTTAKTHLRGLFSKTGETRQADLIRRALSDPFMRLQFGRKRLG
ncbi:hypothetical protein [Caulobacter sp. 17J65-9]|uniref:helix-turn-helix transcriptional regulator n=1 Tax=Caulobacter sp. 17J65-9 TaxID=2709382 RepID=UPI0013C72BDB|nr:hypothetical protein [Caulobacter sp. 17J65-9]NEX93277.1 hypothetical protein [Caulobacter sp. 17J65-9]